MSRAKHQMKACVKIDENELKWNQQKTLSKNDNWRNQTAKQVQSVKNILSATHQRWSCVKRMHSAGERLDQGLRGEGSGGRRTMSRWTANFFGESIGEPQARCRWKEDIERIRHSEAAGGGEHDEWRTVGIEGRVGECVRDGLESANSTSPEIERQGVFSPIFFEHVDKR
jgi:hypothetical protein